LRLLTQQPSKNRGIIFIVNDVINVKTSIMKTTSTKTVISLKSVEKELKAILEQDIRKLNAPQYINNKYAAFLQFIAA
jgi:hypothetical protein